MSPGNSASRQNWIDLAKGIGIILVVYGHVARGLDAAGLYRDQHSFARVDSVIYSFHMPLFFLLSGLYFQSSLKHYGAGALIGKKVDTLLYPYVVWSLIQGGIAIALSHYTNTLTRISDITAILWQPLDQFWFLYALFFIFLLFTPVFKLAHQAAAPWLVGFVLLVAYIANVQFGIPAVDYVVDYGVFFACGILLSQYPAATGLGAPGQGAGRRAGLGAVLLFSLAQYAVHTVFHAADLPSGAAGRGAGFLVALFSIGCVLVLSRSLSPAGFRWLARLGKNSMPIYLMHILFASGTRVILSKLFHVQDLLLQLVAGTLMGLLAPLAMTGVFRACKMTVLLYPPACLQQSRQRAVRA